MLAFAVQAEAKTCPDICRSATTASPAKIKTWKSVHTFAKDDAVVLNLSVNGKTLTATRYGGSDCKAYMDGSGVTALVNTCGPRIVVKTTTIRSKPVKVKIAYGLYTGSAPVKGDGEGL